MQLLSAHGRHLQIRNALFLLAVAFGLSRLSLADPIHDAARKGNVAKVKELLDADPGLVSSKDKMGKTPLHYAAENDQKDVAELLIDHGADINTRDSNGGFAPIDLALSSYHYMDVLELLVARGADANHTADNGLTPLHEAALRGQRDALPLLLSKGAKIDTQDGKGTSPLLWALMMGHVDAAEILVNAGANPNLAGVQGFTPLSLAQRRGYGRIADLLRQHGAQR